MLSHNSVGCLGLSWLAPVLSLGVSHPLAIRWGWTLNATACGLYLHVASHALGPLCMACPPILDFLHGQPWGSKWRSGSGQTFSEPGLQVSGCCFHCILVVKAVTGLAQVQGEGHGFLL